MPENGLSAMLADFEKRHGALKAMEEAYEAEKKAVAELFHSVRQQLHDKGSILFSGSKSANSDHDKGGGTRHRMKQSDIEALEVKTEAFLAKATSPVTEHAIAEHLGIKKAQVKRIVASVGHLHQAGKKGKGGHAATWTKKGSGSAPKKAHG